MAAALLATSAVTVGQAQVYYRYVNDEGIQVLDDSIPPEYAQKGYEVVSLSGDVIRTVEPAPDAATLQQKAEEKRLREDYRRLSRRYSSLEDIEAARARKLENIETNIAIVRGNISGLEAQIRSLTRQAADVERQGRQVPEALLKKLADTRAELAAAEELLKVRQQEYATTEARFAEDITTFTRGRELVERARRNGAEG